MKSTLQPTVLPKLAIPGTAPPTVDCIYHHLVRDLTLTSPDHEVPQPDVITLLNPLTPKVLNPHDAESALYSACGHVNADHASLQTFAGWLAARLDDSAAWAFAREVGFKGQMTRVQAREVLLAWVRGGVEERHREAVEGRVKAGFGAESGPVDLAVFLAVAFEGIEAVEELRSRIRMLLTPKMDY